MKSTGTRSSIWRKILLPVILTFLWFMFFEERPLYVVGMSVGIRASSLFLPDAAKNPAAFVEAQSSAMTGIISLSQRYLPRWSGCREFPITLRSGRNTTAVICGENSKKGSDSKKLRPVVYWTANAGNIFPVPLDSIVFGPTMFGRTVAETEFVVFSFDPLLHPATFPQPVEDAYDGLLWLFEHAEELGLDKDRVVMAGLSMGAYITTMSALLHRDGSEVILDGYEPKAPAFEFTGPKPKLAGLFLYEPPAVFSYGPEFPCWEKYAQGYGILADQLRALKMAFAPKDRPAVDLLPRSYAGFPPTLIFTGGYDLLHDDGVALYNRMLETDAPVSLLDRPKTPHGGALAVPFSQRHREDQEELVQFLLQVQGAAATDGEQTTPQKAHSKEEI